MTALPPAHAADDGSGWTVATQSTTYFAGDWINISVVTAQRPAPVPFLYFNLSNPNGSLIDQRYVQVLHGSANFSFLLPLEASEGNYLLNVTSNSTLIAQVGLQVVYDELNYLSKRVARLETQTDLLAKRLEAQRQQNRDQQAQLDSYLWIYPFCVLWFAAMVMAFRFVFVPVWMYWQELNIEFSPDVKRLGRFLDGWTNYFSPAEREYHQPSARLLAPDRMAVADIANRARTTHPYSPELPKPVSRDDSERRRGI